MFFCRMCAFDCTAWWFPAEDSHYLYLYFEENNLMFQIKSFMYDSVILFIVY